MNFEYIRTIVEVILGLGVIAIGIPYLWSQLKKGKSDVAKDLNDTLNDLLRARDVKIKDLETLTEKQGQRITYLEGQVHTLNTQKTDLEILIKTALKEHFAANPQMANELSKSIIAPVLKNV